MAGQRVVVQASSVSWAGGPDYCMTAIEGHPVVYWTVKRVVEDIPESEVVIAAPAFDRGGRLEFLGDAFGRGRVSLFYGHDASPLDRILDACADLGDEEHIIRVDGLHFCFDTKASLSMLALARSDHFDCVKLPDDFPVQLASDVYRVGALRLLDKSLTGSGQAVYRVHPKFFMFMRNDLFHCAYLEELPQYSDDQLMDCRRRCEPIFRVPRMDVSEGRRIWSGDQLSFHYELALQYLQPDMRVLEVACGDGFGVRIMAPKTAEVHGADIDAEVVAEARRRTDCPNAFFHVEDVTGMSFGSEEFDAVTSMETFEHVDPHAYLGEVRRVLRPGGLLVLSTPQNRMGRIPLTSCHVREYSLSELLDLCRQYFAVVKVIGIKAGRIVVPDDPYGMNTVLVCTKEKI